VNTSWNKLAAGVLLLAIPACFAQVKTDFDRSVDFGHYKTYSWQKVQTRNQLWVGRIKRAVNTNLVSKGWTQVDTGGDVAVVAIETTQNEQTLNTFYDGFGGGWGWRGFGDFGESTTTTETYKVGTLVVDLFDASRKRLIWRGSASATLSGNSDKNIKELNRSVQKLFEHFPPRPAK
jgi:hypothetical protein